MVFFVFGWCLDGRRMLSSREAMHSVISFKPLGMESGSRTAGVFSWSQEGYGADSYS